MHVHACQPPSMRTTIEIPNEQRAKLLELAARQGHKGYSRLIEEAIAMYLRDQERQPAIERALRQRGRLAGKEANALEESVQAIRGRWR